MAHQTNHILSSSYKVLNIPRSKRKFLSKNQGSPNPLKLPPFSPPTNSPSSWIPKQGSEVVTIDVKTANNLLSSGEYRYLDVRTEEEFKKGHVGFDGTLNIPYMFNTPQGRVKNPNFMEQVLPVCTKDDHLVVGCQSGVRSVYATTDLLDAGFKHVYNMGGGYLAWVDNGLPVETPKLEL